VRRKKPGFLELGRRTLFGRPARPVVPDLPPAPDLANAQPFSIGALEIDPKRLTARFESREYPIDAAACRILLMLKESYPAAINREHLAVRVYGKGGTFDHRESFQRQLARIRHIFALTKTAHLTHHDGDAYALEIQDASAPLSVEPNHDHAISPSSDLEQGLVRPTHSTSFTNRSKVKSIGAVLAVVVLLLTIALILFIDRKAGTLWGTPEARQVVHTFPIDGHGHATSDPAFSADGKTLAFTQWLDSDHTAVMALDLDNMTQRQLTDGTSLDRFPRVVPQSHQLLFERTTPSGLCALMKLDLDSQSIVKLADCDHNGLGPITLMPDGAHATFAHRTADSLPLQLVSVGLNDDVLTGVTNPISGMPGDNQPTLSKDGQTLAFVRTKAFGVEDLWALSHQSSAALALTHDLVSLHGLSFDFFDQTVVLSSERGGHAALWRSHLDGFQPELVLESADELTSPSVHPRGMQIAYTRLEPQTHATLIGSTNALLTDPRFENDHRLREISCQADDRSCVAISTERGKDQLVLFTQDHQRKILTLDDDANLESPQWMPDQSGIVFVKAKAGRFDLCTLINGNVSALTHDGNNRSPIFSRDGKRIYFSSRHDGHWQIYQADWPSFTNQKTLTKTGALRGVEAADGTFYYIRPDRAGLWQQSPNDSDPSLLLPDLSPIDWRLFAMTDQGIWYASRRDQHPTELHYYSFADGRVTRIIALNSDPSPMAGMTVVQKDHLLFFEQTSIHRQVEVALLQ